MPPPQHIITPVGSDTMSDLGKVTGTSIILGFVLFSFAIAFAPILLATWGACETINYFMQKYIRNSKTINVTPHPYKIND